MAAAGSRASVPHEKDLAYTADMIWLVYWQVISQSASHSCLVTPLRRFASCGLDPPLHKSDSSSSSILLSISAFESAVTLRLLPVN